MSRAAGEHEGDVPTPHKTCLSLALSSARRHIASLSSVCYTKHPAGFRRSKALRHGAYQCKL